MRRNSASAQTSCRRNFTPNLKTPATTRSSRYPGSRPTSTWATRYSVIPTSIAWPIRLNYECHSWARPCSRKPPELQGTSTSVKAESRRPCCEAPSAASYRPPFSIGPRPGSACRSTIGCSTNSVTPARRRSTPSPICLSSIRPSAAGCGSSFSGTVATPTG